MPRNPKIAVVDPHKNGPSRNAVSHHRVADAFEFEETSTCVRTIGALFSILRSGIFLAQLCHV
jgi:hypothetical protein